MAGANDRRLFDSYLELLGLAPQPPTFDFLCRLVRAHLDRIPFENLSKLLYLRRDGRRSVPDLDVYLSGARDFHFGGTCYSNNPYLCRLLKHLGFQAELNGCDMQNPDVHIVIRVKLDGHEYLVDVGYAAPFLDPMPADAVSEYEIEFGISRYVLRPRDAEGCSRLDLYRNGELSHGYTVNPIYREHRFFAPAISDSYRQSATFMNALLLTRYSPDHSVVIHNYTLTEFNRKKSTLARLKNNSEVGAAIERHFGIPLGLVEEALHGMDLSGNAWS